MSSKIKILNQDCDPSLAKDKSLPQTAYLVEYLVDGMTKFDLVVCSKRVDIFDHYWDNYKENLNNIIQSSGTISPKVWSGPSPSKTKNER